MTMRKNDHQKLKKVLALLRVAHGRQKWECWGDAVSVLIGTILSQNTNRANSEAGFEALRQRFPTWDAVADAPLATIEKCIRVSGLSRTKAPRIRSILSQLRRKHGCISLEHLRELPPMEAYERLMEFDGVGPKTAWCVLLFSFGMKVFPVDTHIHRIAIRLGVLPPRASVEQAHQQLAPLIAPRDRYEMHVLLIAHGRRVCLARRPRCRQCNLLRCCPHGQAMLEAEMEG